MHCNGQYPTPLNQVNMNVLKTFRQAFPELILGFSDHTEDPVQAPITAVQCGATVIEKHFTLNKKAKGPDHFYAVEPHELKALTKAVKTAHDLKKINPVIAGNSKIQLNTKEQKLRRFCYRSLFASKDIQKGELFSISNIEILRPGELEPGLHPVQLKELIGQKSKSFIPQNSPIRIESLLK